MVTDVGLLSSAPAFTTVQINANRGPTAVGTVTITPAAASRTIGATGTLTVAAATANDADGDPFGGFTYQWIQTASATATTPCAPSCPVANVTLTPTQRHERRTATFTTPAFLASGASLFFRMNVGDGFGATTQSANQTYALANTPADRAVRRPRRPGRRRRTASRTTPHANRVYIGQSVTLDGTKNPAGTS